MIFQQHFFRSRCNLQTSDMNFILTAAGEKHKHVIWCYTTFNLLAINHEVKFAVRISHFCAAVRINVAWGKEPICQCRRQETQFDPWVGKISCRRALQNSCLQNSRQKSLAGYSPWGRKQSDTTEWLQLPNFQDNAPPSLCGKHPEIAKVSYYKNCDICIT